MKLYKDGQLVGEFSTTELKELAGVDIEKAADVAFEAVEVKSFEVGDKVEVVGVTYVGENRHLGEIGVIRTVYKDGDSTVDIIGGGCGVYPPSSLKLVEEEPEEVLSYENVKVGEYFVVTGYNSGFAVGEVVKAEGTSTEMVFRAEYLDGSDWWSVYYTEARRATAEEIAEATKPKEVKFEVGDAISVNGRFAFILRELDSKQEYTIQWYSDGEQTYAYESYIRHATDEEKARLQTLIGREKDEYKVGDLVVLLSGAGSGYRGRDGYIFEVDGISRAFIHLKDKGNKTNENDTYIHQEKLKLVTPVEWRHDFVEEVK